ncbi:MAG: hypothetical protein KAW92_11705 [Candidatus Cloacimonetes bacterium]|nr:hypothetical protein [Candidatus Cloacimonadota bacterium]
MFLVYFISVVGAFAIITLVIKGAYRSILGDYLWSEKRNPHYWELIKKVEAEKEEENEI